MKSESSPQPINAAPKIGVFEKNLTWWVLGCIAVGIALGRALPVLFQTIGSLKFAEVNLPVALLIWLMVIPMSVSYTHLDVYKRQFR